MDKQTKATNIHTDACCERREKTFCNTKQELSFFYLRFSRRDLVKRDRNLDDMN